MPKQPKIIILHASINDIEPLIWRRIEVDADISLRTLHHILQAAFGWTSSHLHEFEVGDQTYTIHDEYLLESIDEGEPVPLDDRKAKLGRLLFPGQRFTYLYDFGDSWRHTIHVERIAEVAEMRGYGHITDGARGGPPEDVGGPYGYMAFLDAIERKPRTQEGRELLDWIGGKFDASAFDRRAANAALLRMAWNGWGRK
ncbi:plasmid pRiA4b ORF-3 family protein [Massilia solisilvae]|uniref:Plasmid pRiA4b ORF-3 family protein n=1 Tax=Massilia solisilvae TaxID=1811225 RepID=A0ABT2BF13_9BURK|nr:plasmid pRiA4b ORF-3 family protein [Massilia solisilvae]MCS0607006.1 plasmid pRiA4b ORF-3 family protein [Massilia solisilvae]